MVFSCLPTWTGPTSRTRRLQFRSPLAAQLADKQLPSLPRATAGLVEDAGLVGRQLNIGITLFYVLYVMAEGPGTLLMKYFRPSRFITFLVSHAACYSSIQAPADLPPQSPADGRLGSCHHLLWLCRECLLERLSPLLSHSNLTSPRLHPSLLQDSFASLCTTRLLLGMLESPLFPSLTLYLSGWYRREEQGRRVA